MVSINKAIGLVVSVVVAAFIGSALLPEAISQFNTVDMTNWSSSTKSLWTLLPLFAVLGFVLYFIGSALEMTNGRI